MAEPELTISSPERDLLKYIESQWTLTNNGIQKAQVVFTDKDANNDNQTYTPHVIVQQAGARRKQKEEDDLYDFTFVIKVWLWNRWNKLPTDTDKRLLHWQMINHIKKMFSVRPKKCPTGWNQAYVETTANIALANDLPDINVFQITVKAVLSWI
jgi:hypothetical protein